MTTKVVKGSLWTLAGQVAPLAVSLVTTPFVIRMLGPESYGVLILVGLIPAYFAFADLGMSLASTKFASEAYSEGDLNKEARIVRTAALIGLIASVPIAALLITFASSIVILFNVPDHLIADASLALRIAAVTFVISLLSGIFNTPQLTRLRMDLNTFVNVVSRVIGLIFLPVVLYLGYGIVGAVTVLLVSAIINLFAHIWISSKQLHEILGTSFEFSNFWLYFNFGVSLSVSTIALVLLGHSEKLVLAAFVSVESLAYYSAAFTLANMATMFSGAMMQSLIPAFSLLRADRDREQLQKLYSRSLRLVVLWVVPSCSILFILANPFFTIWAGESFGRESTTPFSILLAGLLFNLVAYVPYAALVAAGQTKIIAKMYWGELVVYGVLVILLVNAFGINGAALAWTIRVIVDSCLLFYFAARHAAVTHETGRIAKRTALGLCIFLPPIGLSIVYGDHLIGLATVSLLFCGVYAYLAWSFLIEVDEQAWIRDWLATKVAQ